MKSWFLERRYLKEMIDSRIKKVKFGQRLKAESKQAREGVQFVITYHAKLYKLKSLLYQDESVNLFVLNAPFLYPRKTSENLTVS